VALARLVLSSATPLWVLDEPFNALDTAATAWLCALLQAHLEAGGVVVLTSHQDVALDALAAHVIPLAL
jgi:heme exporter protein A